MTEPAKQVITLEDLDRRFKALHTLDDGWHGPGSLAASPTLLALVRDLLVRSCTAPATPFPTVFPTPEGGVQAQWGPNVEARFEPRGQKVTLTWDVGDRGSWAELPVTDEEGIRMWLWRHLP